jgi:peptidoglycan/LPS O-acetylase OafA/YrhL
MANAATGEVGPVSGVRTEAAPSVGQGRRQEIPALTGLRFVAAFSILLMHTIEWSSPFTGTRIFSLVGAAVGLIGMPLFFVLSGFVIHYNYSRSFLALPYGAALQNFFSARFARIYPLFIFFAIFGIVSDYMANWIRDYFPDLVSFIVHCLTLTQSWVYKVVVNDRLLLANGFGLSWSISDEFFFYLAYVVFVFLILPLKRAATSLLVIAVFSAVVISALLFSYAHSDEFMRIAQHYVSRFLSRTENQDNSFYRWFFYYSPYVRIWEFVLGCLTAQLFLILQRRDVTRAETRWAGFGLWGAVVVLILYGARYVSELQVGGDHIIIFLSANFGCAVPLAAIIFCTARYRSIVASLLSHPWIIWLGDISYSIYAVHTWTVRPFVRPVANFSIALGVDAVLRIGLALGFTLIVASATYRSIEVPCRRYLRKKLLRTATPARMPLAMADQRDAS